MLELRKICKSDVSLFYYAKDVIESTFPENEYRSFDQLQNLIEAEERFKINIIYNNNEQVGVISYWNFDDFYFIELLATEEKCRNQGIGSQLLQLICKQMDKPIILEIELPTSELTIRRKAFYERNNFVTWPNIYFQPPFREGEEIIPLKLCCYGNLNAEKDFENIKRIIHTQVYHYHE